MKTVLLVNIKPLYVSNETCLPVELTETEKLLNYFNGHHKYSFVEIYTPILKIKGKTYKEIESKINEYTTKTRNFDFQTIVLNKP